MQADLALGTTAAPSKWRDRLLGLVPSLMLAVSRCASVAVQFILQIAVGGMAGAGGLGILQLFTSWSSLIGEGLARGLPPWAMRVVAVDMAQKNTARARYHLQWAVRRIVFLALWLGMIAGLVIVWIDWPAEDYYLLAVAVALGAPLFALLRLGSDALKGAGEALRAVTLENLLLPGCLLLVCAACWLTGGTLEPWMLLGGGVIGFSIALWVIWRVLPASLRSGPAISPNESSSSPDRSDINALWANSLLAVAFLQLPFLLLPWYADTAEIGVYAVAHKLVNVVTTLLILMSAVYGPAFARAAADGGAPVLRNLLRRTQRLSCLIFVPLCAALLLAVNSLAEVFNVPGEALAQYLLILAAGQLVNAATGLSAVLLNMSGGAELETRTLTVAIVTTLVAAPAAGAFYGAHGVAVLFSIVLAGKNLASYLAVLVFLSREDRLS